MIDRARLLALERAQDNLRELQRDTDAGYGGDCEFCDGGQRGYLESNDFDVLNGLLTKEIEEIKCHKQTPA